jgi:polar amino acid transport system substrate-binding protein
MITHRISIEESVDFYRKAVPGEVENLIGALITYPEESPLERKVWLQKEKGVTRKAGSSNIGLIGAGLFAKNVLYPLLKKKPSVRLRALATASGVSSNDSGRKFDVDYVTTDYHEILNDPEVDYVFITTRHSDHASMVVAALEAGKSAYVEKPLATTPEELKEIEDAYHKCPGELMTGFCRRYSPAAVEIMRILEQVQTPKIVHCRINAGSIPPEHWVQREEGGRIVGEVCHFVDFICALTGSLPVAVSAACLSGEGDLSLSDNVSVLMRMYDGSIGNILYSSKGDKSFSREYTEVYGGGYVVTNDDFRKVMSYSERGKTTKRWLNRDLGYQGEIDHFIRLVTQGTGPTFSQDVAVTRATFAILQALRRQEWINVPSAEKG